MKKGKGQDYTSEHIQSLGGLEGVRKNASIYLGSTDAMGVFLTCRELMDNALDEHLAGRNNATRLHIDSDGSYWVLDKGNGIPQGIKELHIHVNGKDVVNKVPTMQAVFGELHTSGKYRTDAYKVSVGTHGIGAKGTNATSEFFEAVTLFKGKWYSVGFKKGKLVSKVQQLTKPPKGPDGKALESGTCVHFKPDPTIFTVKSFPPVMAHEWAETMAYLNPGFAIVISNAKGKKTYFSKKGPIEYVTKKIEKLKAAQLDKQVFEYRSDLADLVVAFTNCEGCEISGYTNGLANTEGGTHLQTATASMYAGLVVALTKMGKERLLSAGKKKDKKAAFTANDFKEGLVGLVNAKLHKAQFSGQNKAKLTDPRLGKAFGEVLTKEVASFFLKNKKLALTLAERAIKLNSLKFNFAKSKKLLKELGQLKKMGMPIKYVPASKATKIADRELYLIEGESAGGSVKEARYLNQAVLPLKGKVANALKGKGDKALESEEVTYMLGAIGFDPKAKDPYEKLQVGKIICLADPDPDGNHINTLLLTLYYKYLPELFNRGMIYVAKTPEFYATHKGQLYTGNGVQAVRKKLIAAKAPASTEVNHIKGWGEISASMLRLLAMDPDTRTLIKIKPLSDEDADFKLLMAEDVDFRKKLLGIQ